MPDLKIVQQDSHNLDLGNKILTQKSFNPTLKIGIENLPFQKQEMVARRGAVFNLLLVGQSGVGKTTFVNTLFGCSILPNIWDTTGNKKQKLDLSTTKITAHKVSLIENDFNLDFTVIDTPGFCDFINNQFSYLPVTDYIDEQLRIYMFQEEQPNRNKLIDNRVHACLYFINPISKGLSSLDVENLKHISSRVNLIPVIAKADTLTTVELSRLKSLVKRIIDAQGIKLCEFIKYEDVKEDILQNIPFSLICSEEETLNEETNRFIRGRKYNWGIAEVENLLHCDFVKLRDILLSNHMVDLISTTENYYERYKNILISTRIKKVKVSLDQSEIVMESQTIPKTLSTNDLDKITVEDLLQIISKYDKSHIDELIVEWNPSFIQKQTYQKKKMNELIGIEEKKFKKWKKALFTKQTVFNHEIEELHEKIRKLESEINLLKQNLIPYKNKPFKRVRELGESITDNIKVLHDQVVVEGQSAQI